MTTPFSKLSATFFKFPKDKQKIILKSLHDFSAATKVLLSTSLGFPDDPEVFIKKMKRETIDKIYRKGTPQTPSSRTINQIISDAKKAGVSPTTMLDLELLAYRGFADYLHEFGGGPDNFDEQACNHLENYLTLLMSLTDKTKMAELIEQMRKYLKKHNNMITDDKYEVFESITGISV